MRRLIAVLTVPSLVVAMLAATGAPGAASPPADPDRPSAAAVARLLADGGGRPDLTRDARGRVTFVGTAAGEEIDNPTVSAEDSVATAAQAHLDRYGAALGAVRGTTSLVARGATHTSGGTDVVRYTQEVGGVPVIGGDVVVTLDADRDLVSILSTTSSVAKTGAALVSDADAEATARARVRKDLGRGSLAVERLGRWLLDPAVIAGSTPRPRTVWRYDVRRGADVRRTVLVDDATGSVVLDLSTIHRLDRVVCDKANLPTPVESTCTSGFARTEAGPASAVNDVNQAFDLSGEVSDLYAAVGGLDLTAMLGVDVGGQKKLASTVRFCYDLLDCPYANAFWNGIQMYYGAGYAAADDVVGHEITHGVIDQYSELFYWGQSGAINESIADIMGEIVDHRNVGPGDSPNSWALGEDLPCCMPGGIRNLQDPTLFGDPDSTQSPSWEPFADNGGVHINSGAGNKTAYLLSQGGSFGGQSIVGIDVGDASLTKTAQLYLLAVQSLSSGSDYADLALVLDQSCQTLRGTAGFTAANCTAVHQAAVATRLALTPANAAQPADAPATCPAGATKQVLLDSEAGTPATTFTTGTRWSRDDPPGWGSNAHSGLDAWSNVGSATTSVDSLVAAAPIAVPTAGPTYLHFHHWRLLEHDGGGFRDGGAVEVDDLSTPAGPVDVAGLPWVNGPVDLLAPGFGNPAAGRLSFSGDSLGYVASRLDLSSFAGRSITPRFTLYNDVSLNALPWYLDDITVYTCVPPPAPERVVAGTVKAKGKAQVGRRLTAQVRRWQPSGLSYRYQWLRNGRVVKGATARKYKLANRDKRKRMSVRVVASKPGYVTAVKTSPRTTKVKPRRRR